MAKSKATKTYKKFKKRMYRNKYRNAIQKVSKYNEPVRFFKRKCKIGTITTNAFGYSGGSIVFRLDQLPNYNEFTSLFDQYCIRYVKVYIVHRALNLSIMETANDFTRVGFPNIISVRDYDDNTAPTSDEAGYNTLREYSKSKTFTYTSERRVYEIGIVPAVLSETYRTGLTTAYAPKFKSYLDCAFPDVPHYAIKYVVNAPNNGGGTTPNVIFDVYATYYLSFKTIR